MRMNDAFPGRFLKADDFPMPRPLTIKTVTIELMGQDRETKPVVWFHEEQKGLSLNKTNWEQIARITGNDDTDHWAGARVELFRDLTIFRGQQTHCVRVRPPQQQQQQQAGNGQPQQQGQPPWQPRQNAPSGFNEDTMARHLEEERRQPSQNVKPGFDPAPWEQPGAIPDPGEVVRGGGRR